MTDAGDDGLLQRQARALGDPTRHAIFRLIGDAPDPIGVRELAGELALHESAIRQHLAKLLAAGLVVEDRSPDGPGRPRGRFRRAPGVLGVWRTENPFERLATLLVDVVRTGADPREAGREAGRAVAAAPELRGGDERPALDVLSDLVADQGFEPTMAGEEGRPELVLGRCPYPTLAAAAPQVVCELHRGMAEGMAEVLDGGRPVEVTGLVRRDPHEAGCRVVLRPRS